MKLKKINNIVEESVCACMVVELNENEKEDVFEVVQSIIIEENCNISSEMIDRAHSIGQVKVNKVKNMKQQDIIIKFLTFRHRTEFFKARNKFKSDIRVSLDLTPKRYQLLKDGPSFDR